MNTETDTLGHLIEIEHKAASLLMDAQTEADKRTAEARSQADADYKAQYETLVSQMEADADKRIGDLKEKHNALFSAYRNELASCAQDTAAFNDLLKKLLFGNTPVKNKDIDKKVKQWVLNKLKEKYGIEEDDFFTAELEIVPAGKLRDVGLDETMIGGYGQDDRICAYTSLKALYEVKNPKKTVMVYLTDKEEIGSEGSTGLKSTLPEYIVGKILSMTEKNYNDQILRETLWNSKALSSDVTAAINPVFSSVHDLDNAARLSYGIAFAKYTGSGGKFGSSDADAEFIQEVRKVFEKNTIEYQIGGFGKVDEGGGGTVAKFLAYYGIRTIDAGPALISMHSLFEISSKADLYETYKAYKVFFEI